MFPLCFSCEISVTEEKYFPNEIVYECIFAQILRLQDSTHISFAWAGFSNYCDFLELPWLIMCLWTYGRGNVSIYPTLEKEGNNKQTVLETSDLPYTSPTADLRFPKMRTDHGNFPAMMDHRRNVTFNGLVIPLETFYPFRNHTGTLRNIISKMFGERCLFQILFWGEPSQRIISFQGYPCLYTIQSVVCLIKPS